MEARSKPTSLGGIAFPGLDLAHHDFHKSLPEMSPAELKNVLYQGNLAASSLLTPTSNVHCHGLMSGPLGVAGVGISTLELGSFTPFVNDNPNVAVAQTLNTMPSQSKGSAFWCQNCQKSLRNKMLYNYHLRAHMGVKPYECSVCGRRFAGKQVLQTHRRLHSGERPYRCSKPGCERAFSARSGLVYHENKHHWLALIHVLFCFPYITLV